MSSDGFNLSLTLNKSLLYRKCLCVMYGLSLWMLIQSSFPLGMQCLIALILLFQATRLIHAAIPTGQPIRLIYQGQAWWCEQAQKEVERFDSAIILLHAGLFFLLKLTGDKNRLLVVFTDQLTQDTFRKLKWIQIIQSAEEEKKKEKEASSS
jgi:hypothetical protein